MEKIKNIDFPHSDLNLRDGLNLRKRDDGDENRTDKDMGQEKQDSIEKLLVQNLLDVKDFPDDRGMEEFNEVPLEEFGVATLAGHEGKGIGKNARSRKTPKFVAVRKLQHSLLLSTVFSHETEQGLMDEVWERAVETALDDESDEASTRSLTLDGAVKCIHGRLPPP